jgi:hypothetical protein
MNWRRSNPERLSVIGPRAAGSRARTTRRAPRSGGAPSASPSGETEQRAADPICGGPAPRPRFSYRLSSTRQPPPQTGGPRDRAGHRRAGGLPRAVRSQTPSPSGDRPTTPHSEETRHPWKPCMRCRVTTTGRRCAAWWAVQPWRSRRWTPSWTRIGTPERASGRSASGATVTRPNGHPVESRYPARGLTHLPNRDTSCRDKPSPMSTPTSRPG